MSRLRRSLESRDERNVSPGRHASRFNRRSRYERSAVDCQLTNELFIEEKRQRLNSNKNYKKHECLREREIKNWKNNYESRSEFNDTNHDTVQRKNFTVKC